MFNERKTAQAAAYLLHRAGGRLPLIKLLKLMYMAERHSLEHYGEPLTGDSLVSMEHGPVLSRTLNHINGAVPSIQGGWDSWISDRAEHDVALRDASMITDPSLDLTALSESDIDALSTVWDRLGHMEKFDIVKFTHDNCSEWKDPGVSMIPISHGDVFSAVGYSSEQADALERRLNQQRKLESAFS